MDIIKQQKQNLFLDFDNTICNSIKAFCNTYNTTYPYNQTKDFKPADWTKCAKWNFSDQCNISSDEEVEHIFSIHNFFEKLEFMSYAEEVIPKLCEKYNVIICSIGTLENLSHKSLWIKENMPYIRNTILINNDGCKMDKSIINMDNGIFIDDVSSNLFSSNARYKYCFGKKYEWNTDWTGERLINWDYVERNLL